MRFIREQIIKTTVFDEELKENSTIIELLKKLNNSSVDIVIEYKDERNGLTRSFDKARIKNYNEKENKVDVQIFQKTGTILVNGLSPDSISTIKLTTNKNNIIIGNDKITKFDFLDI